MKFENDQVFVEELPEYGNLDIQKLEGNYLKVLYIARIIPSVILVISFALGIYLIGEKIPNWILWLGSSLLIVLLSLFILISKKVFEVKGYGLRKNDIVYISGLILRKTTILPFNRVQHIEINHGPIDRIFGLASLKIFTAGGSQSDMNIPGLTTNSAQRIKELIVNKNSHDEEE